MTMISKIADRHLSRQACIYIRQSTLAQVRSNQESTDRQYNLLNKAQSLGWTAEQIRILDRDLGQSGAAATKRADFKTLVGDVAMGQIGAIFALEASRLARSNQDWHRLLELCAITGTLVIDEDGCYDPAEFNDSLVLGMKGTFAQAELHIIRARLHGGKLNKASRGELRFPLPVGFVFEDDKIVLDPDREVQGAVRMAFDLFEREGTAYGAVRRFQELGLRFPRRAYGGAWNGKLLWGRLTHSRMLGILANPSYAGAYVFGRYQSSKQVGPSGEIVSRLRPVPQEAWRVVIRDHHEGYIDWDRFVANRHRLDANRCPKACTRSAILAFGILPNVSTPLGHASSWNSNAQLLRRSPTRAPPSPPNRGAVHVAAAATSSTSAGSRPKMPSDHDPLFPLPGSIVLIVRVLEAPQPSSARRPDHLSFTVQ